MKPGKAAILPQIVPVGLLVVAGSVAGRRWTFLFAWAAIQLVVFFGRMRDARWIDREAHARSIGRRYRPTRTDAGRWTAAPIAEIDKSTCGKLLAGRLRRNPGLKVVVGRGPAGPPSDVLYDPELDG